MEDDTAYRVIVSWTGDSAPAGAQLLMGPNLEEAKQAGRDLLQAMRANTLATYGDVTMTWEKIYYDRTTDTVAEVATKNPTGVPEWDGTQEELPNHMLTTIGGALVGGIPTPPAPLPPNHHYGVEMRMHSRATTGGYFDTSGGIFWHRLFRWEDAATCEDEMKAAFARWTLEVASDSKAPPADTAWLVKVIYDSSQPYGNSYSNAAGVGKTGDYTIGNGGDIVEDVCICATTAHFWDYMYTGGV